MICSHCQRQLRDDSTFCSGCGARVASATSATDPASTEPPGTSGRAGGGPAAHRLERSRSERKLAGVCGGMAEYLRVDPLLVRAAWVVLSIVPGAVLGGVVAYLLAWLIIPDAAPPLGTAAPAPGQALRRSETNKRVGGVCGGLAEYFDVDATPIRLLWVILSVFPGAVVGGAALYAIAWFVIPAGDGSATQPVTRGTFS